MGAGTIILLNGTVSAGKTTLARALQEVMAEPYLYLGADFPFCGGRPHLPGTTLARGLPDRMA